MLKPWLKPTLQHHLVIDSPRLSVIGEHAVTHWGMSTGDPNLGKNNSRSDDEIFNVKYFP